MPQRYIRQSNIESITKEYLGYFFPKDSFLYNFRPDWLRYKKGKNLEIDIFIPRFNIAFEVNGFQHKLKENRERDAFKKKVCSDLGITLVVITHPRQLLKASLVLLIKQRTGDISIKMVPFGLLQRIRFYKPHRLPFTKAIKNKLRFEAYEQIQADETLGNKIRIEAKSSSTVRLP